jgi:hypothetical protein
MNPDVVLVVVRRAATGLLSATACARSHAVATPTPLSPMHNRRATVVVSPSI